VACGIISPLPAPDETTTSERLLQIGEVATAVGLSLRTVRYYEEVGLVTPSARSEGGFRLYSTSDVDRLLLVKNMKPLGLTLDEMRDLVATIDRSDANVELGDSEARRLSDALVEYEARAATAISKLERDLTQARELRALIARHVARVGHARRTAKSG
jgi:MerR family transcriptional regulator, copper efflux regulator